eukprot:3712387-Prymnesium_polylepis.1
MRSGLSLGALGRARVRVFRRSKSSLNSAAWSEKLELLRADRGELGRHRLPASDAGAHTTFLLQRVERDAAGPSGVVEERHVHYPWELSNGYDAGRANGHHAAEANGQQPHANGWHPLENGWADPWERAWESERPYVGDDVYGQPVYLMYPQMVDAAELDAAAWRRIVGDGSSFSSWEHALREMVLDGLSAQERLQCAARGPAPAVPPRPQHRCAVCRAAGHKMDGTPSHRHRLPYPLL